MFVVACGSGTHFLAVTLEAMVCLDALNSVASALNVWVNDCIAIVCLTVSCARLSYNVP